MGYAQFVGRVGALAVALGVTNVVGHPLVAWAEEPSAGSSSTGGAEPAPSTGTPDKPAETQSADPTTAPSHEPADTEEASPETKDDETSAEETEAESLDPTTTSAPEPEETQAPQPDPTTVEVPETKDAHPSEAAQTPDTAEDNTDTPEPDDQSRFVVHALTVSGIDEQSLDAPLPMALAIPVSADLATSSAAPTAAVTITKVDPVTVEETHPFRSLVLGVLGIFGFDPTPGATNDAFLASLWAAYRGYERRFENESPTVSGATVLSTSQTADGYTAVTISVGFTDPDGDTLHFTTTNGHAGTLTANGDGTYTYLTNTPGTDTVTITANDDDGTGHLHGLLGWLFKPDAGHTRTVTLTLNVTAPTNGAPTANDDTATTDEDTPVVIHVLANDTDPDNDALSITTHTTTAHGTVTLNADGTFTYTPNENYNGTDEFTYTATDGTLDTQASVHITINPVNDAPVIDAVTSTPGIGNSWIINVTTHDPDGDSLTTSVVATDPDHVGVTTNVDGSTTVTVTDSGWAAAHPGAQIGVAVYVIDAISPAATRTLDIGTVTNVVAIGDNGSGQTDVPALPAGLTYTAASAGYSHTAMLRSDGSVIAFGNNYFGQTNIPPLPAGVTYTAVATGYDHTVLLRSDGTAVAFGNNDFGQNDIPPLEPGIVYTAISAIAYHTVLLRSDGTVASIGDNPWGQNDIPPLEAGRVYTAIAAGAGFTALLRSDGTAIVIGNGEDGQTAVPPLDPGLTYRGVAAGDYHTVLLRSDGTAIAFGYNGSGRADIPPLGAGLTYVSADAGPSNTALLRSDGTVIAIGDSRYGQNDIPALPAGVEYTSVSVGAGFSVLLTAITTPTNSAPVANDDTATTDENTPVTIHVLTNDTDPDNDPLSIGTFSQGAHGTVTLNADGTLTYTPNENYYGTDEFTYQASDGVASSESAAVVVSIHGIVGPLAAGDPAFSVTYRDPYTGATSGNLNIVNPGDLALTYVISQPAASLGHVSLVDGGGFIFTPTADARLAAYAGTGPADTTFSIDVSNGQDTLTVPITISIDPAIAAVTNSFSAGEYPAGITVSTDGSRIYVTNDQAGSVTVVDAATLTIVDAMPLVRGVNPIHVSGGNPNEMAYVGSTLYVISRNGNNGHGNVTVVDLTTGNETTQIEVGPQPSSLALAGNHLYVGSYSDNTIAVIDTTTNTVLDTISLTHAAFSIAATASRLYATNQASNTVTVIDTTTFDVIDEIPAGVAPNRVLVKDNLLYVANYGDVNSRDGATVSVIDAMTGNTIADIPVDYSAGAMALQGNLLFVSSSELGTMSVINTPTRTVVETLKTGVVGRMTASPDGIHVYAITADGIAVITLAEPAPANPTITVVDDAVSTPEDTPVLITPFANDTISSGSATHIETVPAHGTLIPHDDGSYTYTPESNFNGIDTFTYVVSSGTTSSTGTVTVTVNPVDDAPVIQSVITTALSTTSWRITVTAYDPDGDPLDITITPADPEHVTITPEVNLLSARMFSFAAFDAGPAPTTANYIAEVDPDYALSHPGEPVGATVGVTDGNSPEVTQQQQVATTTNLLGFGDRNGYGLVDIPAAPVGLSYTKIVVGLANSVALLSDGTAALYGMTGGGLFTVPALPENVTYTDAAYSDFTVLLLRSDGSIVTTGFEASLSGIPAAPDGVTYTGIASAGGHTALLRSDGAVTLANLNDSDASGAQILTAGDDLTYTQAAIAADHVVLLRSNGTAVAYTNAGTSGTPNSYGQLDIPALPDGLTYTQVGAGDGFTVLLRSDGTVLTFGKKDNGYTDLPPLPPDMTYTAISVGDRYALALRSDGAVVAFGNDTGQTAIPDLPAGAVYTAIYAGLNGAGVAATGHTTGLSAGPDQATVNEDAQVSIAVLANDTDPQGNPLTITDVTPGSHGSTTINADGTITYTPAGDYYGADSFAYTLSNGVTSTVTGVTVKTISQPDAPRAQDAAYDVAAGSVLYINMADKVYDPPDPWVFPFNGQVQLEVASQPSLGSASFSQLTYLTYTAPTDLGGATSTTFTYYGNDGLLHGNVATVTINFV